MQIHTLKDTCRITALLLILFVVIRHAPAQTPVLVTTDSGQVIGERVDAVNVFKSIPYAAPPVGDLRWREPQKVTPWSTPLSCNAFSSRCPQPDVSDRPWLGKAGSMDEDCLYLNIWAPAKADKPLPVMVWIHGGGFTIGAGSLSFYDGTTLAKQGVVLVSINYRLGPFGFFGHKSLTAESPNHVSGNYGLLDQIAALQWVKQNINQFGGDPNRVTIFGESAGSVSVTCLMASPLSKGLFHRVIAQSGTGASLHQQLDTAHPRSDCLHELGRKIAAKLDITGDDAKALTALRKVSAEDLLKASDPEVVMKKTGFKFGPVIDGYVLPDNPGKVFANGKQHPIPLMIGSNGADGVLHASALPIRRVQGYRWIINRLFKNDGPQILALFPAKTNAEIKQAMIDLMTVSAFVATSRRFASWMQKTEAPAYLYHFTRVSPAAQRINIGAAHGAEIVYIFDTFGNPAGYNTTDHKLADIMRQYWINFATTGNPNGNTLPHWPTYDATDEHMQFGDLAQSGEHLHQEACDIFDRIAAKQHQ